MAGPEIEKLLNAADEAESVELKIFQNAVIKNLKAYQEDPTRANKINIDAARDALENKKNELMAKYFTEADTAPAFDSLREVVRHLRNAGYKVSKSKISRDKGKNLIKVNSDGTIPEAEVRAYAALLDRESGSIEDLSDIHAQKTKREVESLDLKIARQQFELDKEIGKYVRKEEVDQKIVSTLLVMDVSFRQLIDMNMSDLCHILHGNAEKINTARDHLDNLLDELMNKLARTDTFSIKAV